MTSPNTKYNVNAINTKNLINARNVSKVGGEPKNDWIRVSMGAGDDPFINSPFLHTIRVLLPERVRLIVSPQEKGGKYYQIQRLAPHSPSERECSRHQARKTTPHPFVLKYLEFCRVLRNPFVCTRESKNQYRSCVRR